MFLEVTHVDMTFMVKEPKSTPREKQCVLTAVSTAVLTGAQKQSWSLLSSFSTPATQPKAASDWLHTSQVWAPERWVPGFSGFRYIVFYSELGILGSSFLLPCVLLVWGPFWCTCSLVSPWYSSWMGLRHLLEVLLGGYKHASGTFAHKEFIF